LPGNVQARHAARQDRPPDGDPAESVVAAQAGVHRGHRGKYKEVDWAVDISEAVFSDADFYYVPGELIRRDENTQLLRREAFGDIDWRGLPGSARIWASRFESTPFDSIVGIAPKGSKNFGKVMADIEWLHRRGLLDSALDSCAGT
jgi:hypothetical protein